MANVGTIQVKGIANAILRMDAGSNDFKVKLSQALLELDRRSSNPVVQGQNVIGTISSTTTTIAATQITGQLQATQIANVNASSISGLIDSTQIGSVNAVSITGVIDATQIGSVNATSITGVIISSQVADGLIDSLNKYSTSFRPTPAFMVAPALPDTEHPVGTFYYNRTDGKFYENVAEAWVEVTESTATAGALPFYFVGTLSVGSLAGLIQAAQIDTITAGQITGTITVASGVTIEAGTITGTVNAGGPLTINVGALDGTISSTGSVVVHGDSIANLTVPGTAIIDGAIGTAKIANASITDAKVANLNVSKLTAGTATFSSTAVFNQGAAQLQLAAGAVILKAGTSQDLQLTAGSVRLNNAARYVDITGSGVVISGDGTTATLSSTSLTFTAGAANTVISAGGVQIYGGTTGIGIGASTFGASPMKISSGGIEMEFSGRRLELSSAGILVDASLEVTGSISCSGLTSQSGSTNVSIQHGFLTSSIEINSQQVLTVRQPAVGKVTISDAGATYDNFVRDLINQIKQKVNLIDDRLNSATGHGLWVE